MYPVVQQRGNNLTILGRPPETAPSTGLEGRVHLLLGTRVEGPAEQMPAEIQRQTAVRMAYVHPRELGLHLVRREHVDVRDAHRLEDVLLEVIVEFEARDPFDQLARPVDVDAVFPHFARLVDQRLGQVVVVGAGEFVEPAGPGPLIQTGVEERVSKAGWTSVLVVIKGLQKWRTGKMGGVMGYITCVR